MELQQMLFQTEELFTNLDTLFSVFNYLFSKFPDLFSLSRSLFSRIPNLLPFRQNPPHTKTPRNIHIPRGTPLYPNLNTRLFKYWLFKLSKLF